MQSKEEVLSEIARLRRSNDVAEALNLINQQLKQTPPDPDLMVEAMHQALLMQQNELAARLQRHLLAQPGAADAQYKPEVWLRTALTLGDTVLHGIDEDSLRAASAWCREFAATRMDPLYPTPLLDLEVDCSDGTTNYRFTAGCPSCQADFEVIIRKSFLVHREYLCPTCLARHYVDFDLIAAYVHDRYSSEDLALMRRLGSNLHTLRYQLSFACRGASAFPDLCQYLNIDYAFFLNQILLRRVFQNSQSRDARGDIQH